MKVGSSSLKNTRQHYILECLELVTRAMSAEHLNIIEIGCMFREAEGLSTYSIANMLAEKNRSARFVSVDLDQAHLDSCSKLIESRDRSLLPRVELRCGNSLNVLPELVDKMGTIHFAFLDGSGHPGICLKEFEMVSSHLADRGLCLVDDIAETAPTEYYSAQRVFGKGTLIYPLLILTEYLKYKDAMIHHKDEFTANERPLKDNEEAGVLLGLAQELARIGDRDYRILRNPNGRHGMLAYGKKDLLSRIGSLE